MSYLIIIIFSLLIGYRPFEFGSDYQNYIDLYYEVGISEPLYYFFNNISLLFKFNAEFFIFLMTFISGIFFKKGIEQFQIKLEYKILSYSVFWILLMSAHFRSGIAISFFLFFYNKRYSSYIMAPLIHYSYIFIVFLNIFLNYLRSKIILIILAALIFIIFQDEILETFGDFLLFMGRERNYLALNNLMGDAYEHRTLWHLENYKNYLCILYLLTSVFFINDFIKAKFIQIPCFSYLFLGFDAYLAEKTFLASYPLLCIGLSGVDNKYVEKLLFGITFIIVIRDILGRFDFIDLSPTL